MKYAGHWNTYDLSWLFVVVSCTEVKTPVSKISWKKKPQMFSNEELWQIVQFLVHLTQKLRWAITITWHLLSSFIHSSDLCKNNLKTNLIQIRLWYPFSGLLWKYMTAQIGTKPYWGGPWLVPFLNFTQPPHILLCFIMKVAGI